MDLKIIGEKIRAIRIDQGLTQPEVAVKAGVGVSTVSLIENGKGNPNKTTMKGILDVLGTSLEELE
jgi:transcriptional regulator with XRE-family HTH domain